MKLIRRIAHARASSCREAHAAPARHRDGRPSERSGRSGRIGRLAFAPFVFAFLALAGITFADIPITGSIHGNSITYTVNLGSANAGNGYLVTSQNTTTNQSVSKNHTANSSGQVLGTAHFSDGIQGGDTVVVTTFEMDAMGMWQPIATESFTKPTPPLVVRWAKALQRALKELLG